MELLQPTLLWSTVALYCAFAQGQNSGRCETNWSMYVGDGGIFEVHEFEAEEGILLEQRKIIGTITLSGNSTNEYTFDEPYFQKPSNVKTKARPPRFDVVFINISSSGEITTHAPRIARDGVHNATSAPSVYTTQNQMTNGGSNQTVTPPGHYLNTSTMTSHAYTSTSTAPWGTVTTAPANATTTPTPPIECVVAQIVQIYDLDREESDMHHLTISDNAGDWILPIIVTVKVKDINDNSPMFVKESLSSQITKDVKIGEVVAEIKATDADIGINADLRYSISDSTERRGNETESPDMPTFIIHEKLGLVVLFSSIEDLQPPTKITFNIVVKDRGSEYVSNRATSTATISIINDGWIPTDPATKPLSGGLIAGCVMGGVLLFGLLIFIGFRCTRHRIGRRDAQLEFMLDDENLIT